MMPRPLDQALFLARNILYREGAVVDAGHWQGYETQGKPDLVTREILNLNFSAQMPASPEYAEDMCEPNMPWAEDHFQERVSRKPTNPGEEYKNWPHWQGQELAKTHIQDGVTVEQFTHTYQERFWPKHAGVNFIRDDGEGSFTNVNRGLRYDYGDLDDVIDLLFEYPYTRQATFPIFFPEDTGAVHKGRIPCTLHYHFLLRDNNLHMWYPIRSCDAYRHFRDDVYMAVRLNQWVIGELVERELRSNSEQVWIDVMPGVLNFSAYSFHVHMGDWTKFMAEVVKESKMAEYIL